MIQRRFPTPWLAAAGLWVALLWTAQVAAERAALFSENAHVQRGDGDLVHVIDTEWQAAARAFQVDPRSDPVTTVTADATPASGFTSSRPASRLAPTCVGRPAFERPGIRAPPYLHAFA